MRSGAWLSWIPRRILPNGSSRNQILRNQILQNKPSHLPGYVILDLTVGRNISQNLSVSVTGLNVTNEHLLTDNSLTFGGVHWNNPFQIYGQLRYKFHY